MSRVLLVDTNRAIYPIYRWLTDKGHDVWVVGRNQNEPLAKISTKFINLDYSDSNDLADLVELKEIEFLVPGCTDVSYKVCAEVSSGRFPGIDTVAATHAINNKAAFRKAAISLGIPIPKNIDFEGALLCTEVIVKPVDAFSGHGVSIVKNPTRDSLQAAFAAACEASKTKTALIEEYVNGQLHSHSAFLKCGQVIADFVVCEDCSTNPFTVDTSRVIFNFPEPTLNSLRADACKLFKGLGLVDGLIHTQFILSGDHYKIIEVTRRCPGDLYALLIEMSTGYPYSASYAAPFLGENSLPQTADMLRRRIIRHTATSKDGDFLLGFSFNIPIDCRFFTPLATAGDFIKPSPNGRAGLFFLEAESDEEQDIIYRRLIDGSLYGFNYHSSC